MESPPLLPPSRLVSVVAGGWVMGHKICLFLYIYTFFGYKKLGLF